MGIDFGRRRIGVAVSDPDGRVATPRTTLTRRRGKRPPVAAVDEMVREIGAERIVIGLPLSLDGAETEWCTEVRRFGDLLEDRLGVPVAYIDERMTSARAEKALRRSDLGGRIRDDKGVVDQTAATYILQAWLDARSSAAPENGRDASAGVEHT